MVLMICGLNTLSADNVRIRRSDNFSAFQISSETESGYAYQVQQSRDLVEWQDIGKPYLGGPDNTLNLLVNSSNKAAEFFRVVRSKRLGSPEDWLGYPIASNRLNPSALSDESSSYYTIVAAKAFAYFTGTLQQAHHEPVGEVANYFGYAALRAEIRDRGGDQADQGFRGASWMEALEILNVDQRQALYELMHLHEPYFTDFFDIRIDLVDTLWAVREGEEIDVPKALSIGRRMGLNEAELTVTSVETYSAIMTTLTAGQLMAFADIRSGVTSIDDMQQEVPETAVIEAEISDFSDAQINALLAIASKLISWITGTVDDAVVLPPGKISNYFGFANYRYVDRANVTRSRCRQQISERTNGNANLDNRRTSRRCS